MALVLCATFAMTSDASARPTTARIAWVVDGDTFRLDNDERIRIAGIDTAETRQRRAKCRQEIVIGVDATERARVVLTGKTVGIERVGRSYERTVARVTFEGEADCSKTIEVFLIALNRLLYKHSEIIPGHDLTGILDRAN